MPLPLPIDADEVRRLRFALRLSIPELSKASGVAVATIYRIEDGETRTPYAPTVVRLAAALGVDLEDLLLRDGAVA